MVDYISELLTLATKPCVDTLFLSPINLGAHWVLLAINPREDTVYYLCYLRTPLSNRKEMMDTFNQTLAIHQGHQTLNKSRFSKSSKATTKWITIECPRQPNSNDCCYYIMKFMKDIVVHNQMQIPKKYIPACKYDSYSDDQIAQLKEEWCKYVAEKFVLNL